jgi:hypothetical protein
MSEAEIAPPVELRETEVVQPPVRNEWLTVLAWRAAILVVGLAL